MPKTRSEEVVFSVMMAVVMVYAMELYNQMLNAGGFTNQMLLLVFQDLLPLSIVVIMLEKVIAGPLARRMAFRMVTPDPDKQLIVILAVSVCTVCLMCPMMSMVATIVFKQPGSQLIPVWLQTTAMNLPMAFCWQLLFAGPLVRSLFRFLQTRDMIPHI